MKRGPNTENGKRRALANLELGRWPPGVSGNPAGRQPAGLSVAEWWNQMQEWTLPELQKVADDPNMPAAKAAAAHQWIAARGGAGGALDRICDRTNGRPTQPHTFNGDPLTDVLNSDPRSAELADSLARRLAMAHKPGGNGESAN